MLDTIREILFQPAPTYAISDIPGFPNSDYQDRVGYYERAERWFTGSALNDQPAQQGEKKDLYPVRINPIPATVMKHAYMLFGEAENNGLPLVIPKFIPRIDAHKELAPQAEETIHTLWWENNGRSIMIENAIMSQIYGGCVFKATYVPWETIDQGGWRILPFRLDRINPKFFYGRPDGGDMYRLAEGWYVHDMDWKEARQWGVNTQEGESYLYWEYWNRESYSVNVNDQVARRYVNGEWIPLGGANPFKHVPMYYIPHIRAGGFWGVNAYDHLVGYIKELNLRYGDYGDAVNDDSHPVVATRNIQGTPVVQRITSWLETINLGGRQGLMPNEGDPDMFQVGQAKASTAMADILVKLYNQFERDSYIPPVAYGEDEGSQRSGQTLAIRFWPLTSHSGTERYFWTPGLDVLEHSMIRMLAIKKVAPITMEHAKMRIKQSWYPYLPRDREVDVQEWVARAGALLGSPDHLLELTGDVEDIEEEKSKMLEWKRAITKIENEIAMQQLEAQKEIAETQARVQAQYRNQSPRSGGNGSSGGQE